ncbi:hypothetical protein FXO38_10973 [Capsicum annuum]|nr:hypothetical protein FXO38_10973 [Capsicum annuum]
MSSNISHPLETLQLIEREWSSFSMYSYDARIPKIINRGGARISKNYCDYDKLQRIEEDWGSFREFSIEYRSKSYHLRETLGAIRDRCSSIRMLLDDYLYAEESDALDTLQQKMHNFLETLLQISEECDSFLIFLEKYLPLEESIPFEALKTIIYKCDSFNSLSKEYLSDGLKFLKRDFKFLDIILNSQILVDEPDVREKGQVLLQDAEADVIIYSMQEMLNILRTNLINLPKEALEFHRRDIDSVIADAGLLVYSLLGSKHEKQVIATGETNQALIWSNSEGNQVLPESCCSCGTARAIGWTYDVEYIIDACKEEVPDWCLSIWILHIIEDINILMKEVGNMQEMRGSDPVLRNTIEAARERTPQFASNPSRSEEMVGFEDVMVELTDKLIRGSSGLDVISIVGMTGLGKQAIF